MLVSPLSPPVSAQLLLSFDFDGTLHDPASVPAIDPDFFCLIEELRKSHGAIWGINTGRSMHHFAHGLVEGKFPFAPDYAVVCEREIYVSKPDGHFVAEKSWNQRCARDIDEIFVKAKKVMQKIREHIGHHTGAHWMEEDDGSIGIIARTTEEMDWIVTEVKKLTMNHPLLGWQRSTIYLRFGHKDYQKGSALAEVARLHQLSAAQVFAMGDSHNDLEMLDHHVAQKIACPANAVSDVVEHIRRQNGYVCRRPHSQGVIEALQHFFA